MTEKKDSKEDFESILKVGNEVTIYGVQVQWLKEMSLI